MTNQSRTKWNSLGDFLKAKEEKEKQESTPVATPVLTPAATPVEISVPAPAATPVTTSLPDERQPYLDATHGVGKERLFGDVP